MNLERGSSRPDPEQTVKLPEDQRQISDSSGHPEHLPTEINYANPVLGLMR